VGGEVRWEKERVSTSWCRCQMATAPILGTRRCFVEAQKMEASEFLGPGAPKPYSSISRISGPEYKRFMLAGVPGADSLASERRVS
jgi:hypothetical protein